MINYRAEFTVTTSNVTKAFTKVDEVPEGVEFDTPYIDESRNTAAMTCAVMYLQFEKKPTKKALEQAEAEAFKRLFQKARATVAGKHHNANLQYQAIGRVFHDYQ